MSIAEIQFAIFCKSFQGDLLRAKRLALSISKFNHDQIPVYFCVPEADLEVFKTELSPLNSEISLITDEEIVAIAPGGTIESYRALDGRVSQQILKSEAWRVIGQQSNQTNFSYLCIDSDSEFINEFHKSDFFSTSNSPYTVMHDNAELLEAADLRGITKVRDDFYRSSKELMAIFERSGEIYSFGPTPVIWHSAVWSDLQEQFLAPKGMTLWSAIARIPNELHWYGEALLKFKSIPIEPIGPLFRNLS